MKALAVGTCGTLGATATRRSTERINIFSYMLWIAVLPIALLRAPSGSKV